MIWFLYVVAVIITVIIFIFADGGFKDGFELSWLGYLIFYIAWEALIAFIVNGVYNWFH